MDPNKSLDDSEIIAALIRDTGTVHGLVYNIKEQRLDIAKMKSRCRREGLGFLTKTLPRLGKALQKALTEYEPLDATKHGFAAMPGSKLPRFLGSLFKRVLNPDGTVLTEPCTKCVRSLFQILLVYYKYEVEYDETLCEGVVSKFIETEKQLPEPRVYCEVDAPCEELFCSKCNSAHRQHNLVTRASILLNRVLCSFDPMDIKPRHGPGVVSTKEQLWEKYQWTNISSEITRIYPLDEYFFASGGAVCDSYTSFDSIGDKSLPARVILVPKDSRGPRLISCEPVDYQWVQQGLGRALVNHIEKHPLTKWNVFFTDQAPNQRGAYLGSLDGRYATLDLNEASDRVTLDLVRAIFPSHLLKCLEACRSGSTELPDNSIIRLKKYAPMGSALCFPVLALTVWALLSSIAPDADTKDGILVYGDDVIVPKAFASSAIEQLESVGLKINRDKSCIRGFYRESCGTESFHGLNVTPVRLRTVWSTSPAASVYTSWIAYANSFYDKQYYRVYNYIIDRLFAVYGDIPEDTMGLSAPSLRQVPAFRLPKRWRINPDLQKKEWKVRDVKATKECKVINGWSMLLRSFVEHTSSTVDFLLALNTVQYNISCTETDASQYTHRRSSLLVRRWR